MQPSQKQLISLQIKSHPAQLASLSLETKSCAGEILGAGLCVIPPVFTGPWLTDRGAGGLSVLHEPFYYFFFWLYSMPSLQDTWKPTQGCSQPRMTCWVLTWTVQLSRKSLWFTHCPLPPSTAHDVIFFFNNFCSIQAMLPAVFMWWLFVSD